MTTDKSPECLFPWIATLTQRQASQRVRLFDSIRSARCASSSPDGSDDGVDKYC